MNLLERKFATDRPGKEMLCPITQAICNWKMCTHYDPRDNECFHVRAVKDQSHIKTILHNISREMTELASLVSVDGQDRPFIQTKEATSESCQEHYKSRYNCEEWREMIDELMVEVKGLVTIVEMVLFGFKANYTEDDVAGLIRDALWHHCDLVVKEEKHERY